MLIEALAGVTLTLVATDLWLLRRLHRAGALARPIQVTSLGTVTPTPPEPTPYLRERVQAETDLQGEPGLARCLAAMQWLVAQFPPPEVLPEAPEVGHADDRGGAVAPARIDPRLFPHPRRPHCGEVAALLGDTLTALGIEHRRVALRKNSFDPHDSHISVEAHCDGRWVLFDPTFNATFTDDTGQPLNAQDIKARVFTGDRDAIRTTVHGRALCPLALDYYYVDLFACFNNVFILDDPECALLLRIPPLRYAFGPRLHFEKLPDESATHLALWQSLYRAAAVWLPVLILAALVALATAAVTLL